MTDLASDALRIVGQGDDIPEGSIVPFYLNDLKRRISVARVEGRLYAFDDLCTCAEPACPLSVQVIADDTGEPLAGARVSFISERIASHPHFCTNAHGVLGPYSVPSDVDALTDTAGRAQVGFAVGGNAVTLADREGFEHALPIPTPDAPLSAWQALFEGAKLRAERAIARPVTHAVLVFAAALDPALAAELLQASEAAGIELLRIVTTTDLPVGEAPAEAAAIIAEDMAPRPESF